MSAQPETVSLFQFFQRFPDEEAARQNFERNRWAGEVSCPYCGSVSVAPVKNMKPMPWRCRDCRQHFSVRSGTVLAESRLPLQKWLMAIYMMTTARNGIPSTQMARELDITQKSAWFLAQRIRETWLSDGNSSNDMSDHVQIDKTYVGGSERNKQAAKKLRAGRGTVDKMPVIGIRGAATVTAMPTANAKAATLQGFVRDHAAAGATGATDSHASYDGLAQ